MKELSQYQSEGAEFLTKERFRLLADQPGLGKTAQVIVAADMVRAERILVICPAVARINWDREFQEWSIYAPEFKICVQLSDEPASKTIVSYEYATANSEKLIKLPWDLVVCDESHFIKEPEAKRTQRIYGKSGVIRKTNRLWCLSGTPAPNHVGELWAMLYTFGATSLSYESFIDRYCDTRPTFYHGKRETKVTGTKKSAIPEIKKILSKVMLRRLKSEVLKDLPPIKFETLTVEGSPLPDVIRLDMGQVKKEEALVSEADLDLVLEKLGKSVSTLRRYVGLQKVEAVAEIVTQELTDGAYPKIVIFAIHTDVIAMLKNSFQSFNPVVVNGSVKSSDRQNAIDTFQTKADCRVFLGNISAAGTAITLTAADQVLFVEQSWTPGDNAQAADRCHRRGQTMPVTVRMVALADSIDEKVTAVLKKKTEQLTQIFDKSETHLIGE